MQIPLWIDSTSNRGEVTKNKITYNSSPVIYLNNPADAVDSTYDIEDVTISPTWDEVVEPNPDRDGSSVGNVRELQKIIVIRGWIRATDQADRNDKNSALIRAFHPVLAHDADTATHNTGFLALDFNVPTADTVNWPTGLIAARYYVRPIGNSPVPVSTRFDDLNSRIQITLRAADPRCYEQTTRSANRTGNGTITCANALATYGSYPTIALAFTNAPTADFTIQRTTPSGDQIITIDHTKIAASKTLTINTEARTAAYADGTDKTAALKVSSEYFDIRPAVSNTITVASGPSDLVTTITWRRAFA